MELLALIVITAVLFGLRRVAAPVVVGVIVDILFMFCFLLVVRGVVIR